MKNAYFSLGELPVRCRLFDGTDRLRALPDFILEARWLDYIGKMTVDEEGIYLSFSGEYAEEAAKLE